MRAIVPGFINYKYREGIIPGYTKQYFNKFKIFTVHGIITLNTLLFLHKVRNFPQTLPKSVNCTISVDSPVQGSTHETIQEWLSIYNNCIYKRSVIFKGLLLAIIPEISDLVTPLSLFSLKFYKRSVKEHLLKIQSIGALDEWENSNFLL